MNQSEIRDYLEKRREELLASLPPSPDSPHQKVVNKSHNVLISDYILDITKFIKANISNSKKAVKENYPCYNFTGIDFPKKFSFRKHFFIGRVILSNSIDSKEVIFNDCSFECPIYSENFESISFVNCTFHTSSVHLKCSNLKIKNSEFNNQVNFLIEGYRTALSNTKFNGGVYLFPGQQAGVIQINDCTFSRSFLIENQNVQSALQISNTSFLERLYCTNSAFNNLLYFTECSFWRAPIFFGTKIHHGTNFKDCNFYEISPDAAQKYRVIKDLLLGIGDEHQAETFNSYELTCRLVSKTFSYLKLNRIKSESQFYKQLLTVVSPLNWLSKDGFFSFLYLILNNYGTNPWLPVAWISCITIIFFNYCTQFGGIDVLVPTGYTPAKWEVELLTLSHSEKSAIFVAQSILWPLKPLFNSGVELTSNLSTHYKSLLVSGLSSFLLYLFIAGLRRKFKVYDRQ